MARQDDILSRLGPAARRQAVDQLADEVLRQARGSRPAPVKPIQGPRPDPDIAVLRLSAPPSTNNLFASARKTAADGHQYEGRIKTAEYRRWTKTAGQELQAQRLLQFSGPVMVDISCARPAQRKSDADNRIKAVLDALVQFGVLVDDAQVEEVRCRWAPVTGCVVTITRFDAAAPDLPSEIKVSPQHIAEETEPAGA